MRGCRKTVWWISAWWIAASFVMSAGIACSEATQISPIVGRWQHKDPTIEITADFMADGTFSQVNRTTQGQETYRGRYSLDGQALTLVLEGLPPQQASCRFPDGESMILTYPSGQVLEARRIRQAAALPPAIPASPSGNPPPAKSSSPAGTGQKPARLALRPLWEPNERAFTVLVPADWRTAGGVFNVNPRETNGPGNTIVPKCDFTVRNDAGGTVMIRWLPSWNYADLTFSPSGWSLFHPGQYYQGMLCRPYVPAKTFLLDLLRKERPQAADIRVVTEDAMPEVTAALTKNSEAINLQLRQMGLRPNIVEALAILVEYVEGGRRFREALSTAIVDSRGGAFMWTNEHTLMFRAPSEDYESWKPVLDLIQTSLEWNPQWVASVVRATGERAKMALDTQRYVNRVAAEIVENRRRTNAEIRHEQWLFITGQEEYKNPFDGRVERGTSAYRYRWVNNQGEILYTDENSFDPNEYEGYNTKEWKRSPVWDRR